MEKSIPLRELFLTDEFQLFYGTLPDKVKHKFDYVLDIIRTERVLTAKHVKHLENTKLYEFRVSVSSNEYRTIMFTMDNENIILAKNIIVLNGFLKKSTKDYRKQIEIAQTILNRLYDEND